MILIRQIVFGSGILFSAVNQAAEYKIHGSLDQQFGYNENLRMQEDPEGSLWYLITPTLKFSRETDISSVTAYASYGTQFYPDLEGLDQDRQSYGLTGSLTSERSQWGLDTQFSILPTQDTAVQEGAGIFFSNATREFFQITPSWVYQLTEADLISLTPSYSNSTYSEDTFNDYDVYNVDLGWQRQWNDRLIVGVNVAYNKYKSNGFFIPDRNSNSGNFGPTESEIDSYSLNFSANYIYSEQWTFNGAIGGRYTDSSRSSPSDGHISNIDSGDPGFLANVSASYQGESLSGNFGVARTLMATGGTNGLEEQTRFNVDLSYALSERLNADFLAYYQLSESAVISGSSQRDNFIIQPSINWKMTPDLGIRLTYAYRWQDAGIATDSNSAFLSVNYIWQGVSFAR